MSAWIEEEEGQDQRDIEATFEDNFVSEENKEFQKLDDSDQYLQILESKLKKIKKNSDVLSQLQEKRFECINNLLNSSGTITTDNDIELDKSIEANKIVNHLIPAQAQSIGEIVHLVKHDLLDILKQEQEQEEEVAAAVEVENKQ